MAEQKNNNRGHWIAAELNSPWCELGVREGDNKPPPEHAFPITPGHTDTIPDSNIPRKLDPNKGGRKKLGIKTTNVIYIVILYF